MRVLKFSSALQKTLIRPVGTLPSARKQPHGEGQATLILPAGTFPHGEGQATLILPAGNFPQGKVKVPHPPCGHLPPRGRSSDPHPPCGQFSPGEGQATLILPAGTLPSARKQPQGDGRKTPTRLSLQSCGAPSCCFSIQREKCQQDKAPRQLTQPVKIKRRCSPAGRAQ